MLNAGPQDEEPVTYMPSASLLFGNKGFTSRVSKDRGNSNRGNNRDSTDTALRDSSRTNDTALRDKGDSECGGSAEAEAVGLPDREATEEEEQDDSEHRGRSPGMESVGEDSVESSDTANAEDSASSPSSPAPVATPQSRRSQQRIAKHRRTRQRRHSGSSDSDHACSRALEQYMWRMALSNTTAQQGILSAPQPAPLTLPQHLLVGIRHEYVCQACQSDTHRKDICSEQDETSSSEAVHASPTQR